MKRAILLVATCAMGVAGCLPEDLPAYVNNGRTILAVTREEGRDPNSLWTVDVATKRVKRHSPGKDWHLRTVKVLHEEVLACWWGDPKVTGKEPYLVQRLDFAKGELVDGPSAFGGKENTLVGLIPICYEGRKCALLGESGDYKAFFLPGLVKDPTLQPKVELAKSAGNGWWVDCDGWCKIYDPNGKLTATISENEFSKGGGAGEREYVRVGEGGKALMLVTGTNGGPWFSVFDTESGALIWKDGTRNRPYGNPSVSRKEVWAVENEEKWVVPAGADANANAGTTRPAGPAAKPQGRYEDVTLVRYTPPAKADSKLANREVILTYPVGSEWRIGDYAPSPDGSHFLVVLDGKQPKLLFIPIRKDATVKDVGVVELKEK